MLATKAAAGLVFVSRNRKRRFRVENDAFHVPTKASEDFLGCPRLPFFRCVNSLIRDWEGVRRTLVGPHTVSVERQGLCVLQFFAFEHYPRHGGD